MTISTIMATVHTWLKKAMGRRHAFTITFNADLVTGNTVNGSFDAEAMDPVVFASTHAATMAALAAEIQSKPSVITAVVTAARVITVTGFENGNTIAAVGPTVTGGASQAVAAIATTQAPVAIPVIFSFQNAPSPSPPYADVRIGSIVPVGGRDELKEWDADGIGTFKGHRRATITVNVHGADAVDEARRAIASLDHQTSRWIFEAAGIAVLEHGTMQNLTAMLETKYQERAAFDFFIGFADEFTDDIGVIEHVELTGQIEGAKTGTVTVGPRIIDAT